MVSRRKLLFNLRAQVFAPRQWQNLARPQSEAKYITCSLVSPPVLLEFNHVAVLSRERKQGAGQKQIGFNIFPRNRASRNWQCWARLLPNVLPGLNRYLDGHQSMLTVLTRVSPSNILNLSGYRVVVTRNI